MYRASDPSRRSCGGFGGVGWQVWSSLFLQGKEAGALGCRSDGGIARTYCQSSPR
jgi:hypothetical protein